MLAASAQSYSVIILVLLQPVSMAKRNIDSVLVNMADKCI
jgi:hypothetical protein